MRTIQHWIAGSETTGASTRFGPVYNPATGEQQAQVALATPADVDAAVQAAAKAFDSWRDVSLVRRARVMFALRDLIERHLDELSGIVADEHGKVLSDARYVHERASASGKRVQALGGAKNHAVVLPDADIEFAANHVTAAGYGSAGQRCMAISAVVAVGNAGDALVARLRDLALDVRVGPGRGLTVTGHEGGFFVGPTLFDHVSTDMDIYRDEIFGPVLVVLRASAFREALDIVNANPYGNGTAIFTSSGRAARDFQRNVQVGMIGVNVPIPVPMAFYSFGGWKDSLFGDTHVHGPEGVRFYTRAKAVTSRWPDAEGRPDQHGANLQFPTAT